MKQIISGAKGFTILCKAQSKTYLPDILDLKDKVIKYFDCFNAMVQTDADGNTIASDAQNCFINLMEQGTQNLFIKNTSLSFFIPTYNLGKRYNVLKKIDLVNSYIENTGTTDKYIFISFYYNEPQVQNEWSEGQRTNIDYTEITMFSQLENKIYFPENRTLYNKQISNIICPWGEIVTTPSGKTTPTASQLTKFFLTLQKNNFKFIENIPLVAFVDETYIERLYLSNITFDLINSYVTFPESLRTSINGKAIFLNIEYK